MIDIKSFSVYFIKNKNTGNSEKNVSINFYDIEKLFNSCFIWIIIVVFIFYLLK